MHKREKRVNKRKRKRITSFSFSGSSVISIANNVLCKYKAFLTKCNKMESFYNIKIFLSGRCYSVQAFWGAMHGQTGHRRSRKRSRARAKVRKTRARVVRIYKDNITNKIKAVANKSNGNNRIVCNVPQSEEHYRPLLIIAEVSLPPVSIPVVTTLARSLPKSLPV